jgi:hypothetical protein
MSLKKLNYESRVHHTLFRIKGHFQPFTEKIPNKIGVTVDYVIQVTVLSYAKFHDNRLRVFEPVAVHVSEDTNDREIAEYITRYDVVHTK